MEQEKSNQRVRKPKTEAILEEAKRRREEREKSEVEEETRQVVHFALGDEWYGLSIENIERIVRIPKIFPVPSTPDYIMGVVNLRGDILSVIDLKKFLGLPEAAIGEETLLIVVEESEIRTSFLVDSVEGIVDIPISAIEAPLSTIEKIRADYIDGEAQMDDRILVILNLHDIMNSKEMKRSSGGT